MKTSFIVGIGLIVIVGLFAFIPKTERVDDIDLTDGGSPMDWDIVSANSAVIKTEKGDIEVELFLDDAPLTVRNFATLAANGYYDNLTFHRYEPGFVIQGGDPSGNGSGGQSVYGPTFEDELNPETASYQEGYKRGVLAMANRGPNTNSSQFFIMLEDNDTLPKSYTIFGRVTSGMDVVDQIRAGSKILSIAINN